MAHVLNNCLCPSNYLQRRSKTFKLHSASWTVNRKVTSVPMTSIEWLKLQVRRRRLFNETTKTFFSFLWRYDSSGEWSSVVTRIGRWRSFGWHRYERIHFHHDHADQWTRSRRRTSSDVSSVRQGWKWNNQCQRTETIRSSKHQRSKVFHQGTIRRV